MSRFEEELKRELKGVGASNEEIGALLLLARKLSDFPPIKRSSPIKSARARTLLDEETDHRSSWYERALVSAVGVALLLISVTSVVRAQQSIPGESLYPLKRWSESAAILVQPEFRDEIPVRRSEEIKQLVEQNRDSLLLETTLTEYKEEVQRNEALDPVKIKESLSNLEEAKEQSSGQEKEQIDAVLQAVEPKIEGSDGAGPGGSSTPGGGLGEEKSTGR